MWRPVTGATLSPAAIETAKQSIASPTAIPNKSTQLKKLLPFIE
jgi:hypothetical protein